MSVDGCLGLLRGTVSVTVLDLSRGGLMFESRASVRPGTTGELRAQMPGFHFSAHVVITRCSVTGSIPDGDGGRAILYRGGATILRMEPSRVDELQKWLVLRARSHAQDSLAALESESEPSLLDG